MSRKKAPSRLLTDAVREVRNTRSRFLSLLVLSALACASWPDCGPLPRHERRPVTCI